MPSSMILPVLLDFVGTYFPQIPQDRHKGLRVRHGNCWNHFPIPNIAVPLARMVWGRALRRCSMSTPLNRDLGLLLYAPKWMRDELRVQECVEEIQELNQRPPFDPPPPAASPTVEEGGVPHWLAPNLMPEAAPVPRGPKVSMIVCFLLAIAVPAIAAPL